MASSDRDGRLLPEWPPAHVGGLVRAAPAALVSRRYRIHDSVCRTGFGLDAVSAAPPPHHLLLYTHAVSGWNHSHCELHVPELPGTRARLPAARRRICALDPSCAMEELGPQKFGRGACSY